MSQLKLELCRLLGRPNLRGVCLFHSRAGPVSTVINAIKAIVSKAAGV